MEQRRRDQHTHTRWAAVDNTVEPAVAVRIRDAATWPTLARHLATIDAGGADATAALAAAVA